MIDVQDTNPLNVQNYLLILHGSTRVQHSHSFWEETFPPPALGPPAAPHSLLCTLHHPLQSLSLGSGAAAVSRSNAGAADALHHTAVEAPHGWAPHSSMPQLPEKSRGAGWSLWPDRKCCSIQVSSAVRCTPRYLNLETTSTAASIVQWRGKVCRSCSRLMLLKAVKLALLMLFLTSRRT